MFTAIKKCRSMMYALQKVKRSNKVYPAPDVHAAQWCQSEHIDLSTATAAAGLAVYQRPLPFAKANFPVGMYN